MILFVETNAFVASLKFFLCFLSLQTESVWLSYTDVKYIATRIFKKQKL